jgi:hypothetical protein
MKMNKWSFGIYGHENWRTKKLMFIRLGTTIQNFCEGRPSLIFNSGIGAKFSIVPLVINLASGIALLSIATAVTDIVALQIFPKRQRNVYYHAKVQMVNAQSEETNPLLNS